MKEEKNNRIQNTYEVLIKASRYIDLSKKSFNAKLRSICYIIPFAIIGGPHHDII